MIYTLRPGILWWMPLAGVLLALGYPNDLLPGAWGDRPSWWIAWLALVPLCWAVLVLPGARGRWAVALYALAFYLANLWWLTLFGAFPWVLIAVLLTLFFPLALGLTQWLDPARRHLPLIFALAFTGLEWFRGRGIFGFPWSELGASQVDGETRLLAAVGGVPVITLLMLLATGGAVQALRERRVPYALIIGFAGLIVCGGLGAWQANAAWLRTSDAPRQHIVLVQPNFLKGLTPDDFVHAPSSDELQRRLDLTIRLSGRESRTDRPRLILWPESTLRTPPYYLEIAELCLRTHSYLLLGAPGYAEPPPGMSNSAYLFSPQGVQIAKYDKVQLVPFGEFVPLRPLVERFYTVRDSDIRPGHGHAVLRRTPVPTGVGVCFESLFPDISRSYANQRAELLVFLTNDAWFHQTAGGRQHFNHARFRAVETGLPVARAASTGISGFIDPRGRILAEISTYREDALGRNVSSGRAGTLFTAGGWLLGPVCLYLLPALAMLRLLQAWRRRHTHIRMP